MTAQWGLLSTARINDAFIEGVAQSQPLRGAGRRQP